MNGKRQLTNNQVERIRRLYAGGIYTQSELAEKYGVAAYTIGKLTCGETYASAPGPITPRPARTILSDADVVEIRKTYADGDVTQREIAKRFGVSTVTIGKIVLGNERASVGGPVTRKERKPLTAKDAAEIRRYCAERFGSMSLAEIYAESPWVDRASVETFSNAATGRTHPDIAEPAIEAERSMAVSMVKRARRLAHTGKDPRLAIEGTTWSHATLKKALVGASPYDNITTPAPYTDRLKPRWAYE